MPWCHARSKEEMQAASAEVPVPGHARGRCHGRKQNSRRTTARKTDEEEMQDQTLKAWTEGNIAHKLVTAAMGDKITKRVLAAFSQEHRSQWLLGNCTKGRHGETKSRGRSLLLLPVWLKLPGSQEDRSSESGLPARNILAECWSVLPEPAPSNKANRAG